MRLEEIGDTPGFIVNGYGNGGFRISGKAYSGSVLILPAELHDWTVTVPGQITLESLTPVISAAADIEVLLVGCGPSMYRLSPGLCDALREQHGISVDFMDTGAACRTFNVLQVDGRAVAAALVAV